jgi:hypothetical protein
METTQSWEQSEQRCRAHLNRCNRTELYQLCRRLGLNAHPTATREGLIALLLGAVRAPAQRNPVDLWRDAIIGLLTEHWTVLKPQLKCPAKDMDNPDPEKHNPKPCYGCHDVQVITCVVQNGANEARLRAFKPKE